MPIILNLSTYSVSGAKFNMKGKNLLATCNKTKADELLALLKSTDGFSAVNAVIVPADDSRLWTFFLLAWRKEFGEVGRLALSFSNTGGPISNLGDLTTIASFFG